jgi:glycosyltransferase involved in cell wall biosynthesis
VIDLFVLTSLWEGLPLSILEAMAARKPVVAFDVKGTNELVVDGHTGYLVQPKHVEKISERILKLLGDRDLVREMGLNGYLRVKRKYNLEKVVNSMDLLYEELLTNTLNSTDKHKFGEQSIVRL